MSIGPRPPVGGSASTPKKRHVAKLVLASQEQETALVRTAASKWQAGLAGLLAIITSTMSLGLGKELRELTPWARYTVGGLLIVALGLAVIALFSALASSGGLPRLVETQKVEDLGRRDAVAAAGHLRTAIRVTVSAVLVFVIALSLAWLAPAREKESEARITAGAVEVCGKVDVGPTFVMVTTADERVYPLALDSITAWVKVTECPTSQPTSK